ncbi:hypothetical protein KHHGKMAE_3542 [Methylobacterium persicinum]|nr:hypothetical protein KHHGKMAE_3542 [Methylobacterium persicinum]
MPARTSTVPPDSVAVPLATIASVRPDASTCTRNVEPAAKLTDPATFSVL